MIEDVDRPDPLLGRKPRRAERLLLLLTPLGTMATVALGLRVGAGGAVRAAVVYGAAESGAGTGLAWQLITFEESHGTREALAGIPVAVVAGADGTAGARWSGVTNEDGVAEVVLPLLDAREVRLDVRAGSMVLARGVAQSERLGQSAGPRTAWARFARREGPVALDVAVLGQRVASGFPASVWIRATDVVLNRPVAGVAVEVERDASLSGAAGAAVTDARGWAHLVLTPLGYAVPLILHARAADGRTGEWAGGLFVSPGAMQLSAPLRVAPDAYPELEVVAPNVRSTAYVEIDDARGRAWATTVALVRTPERSEGADGTEMRRMPERSEGADGTEMRRMPERSEGTDAMPRATVHAPKLRPGLYWAAASGDPRANAELGPGTVARPFFVAESDEAALAFGGDADACAVPRDVRDTPRTVAVCLALAAATATPRYVALDGFVSQRAHDAEKRARGLGVALGAVGIAMALEATLLIRIARRSPARPEGGARVAVAILVALLGFALLAALLIRAG